MEVDKNALVFSGYGGLKSIDAIHSAMESQQR